MHPKLLAASVTPMVLKFSASLHPHLVGLCLYTLFKCLCFVRENQHAHGNTNTMNLNVLFMKNYEIKRML